jgi:hypothetical protein
MSDLNYKRQLLDEDPAAEFLGVAPSTLMTWRCTRRYALPYIKIGRRVKYDITDLVEFIESRKVRPEADPNRD